MILLENGANCVKKVFQYFSHDVKTRSDFEDKDFYDLYVVIPEFLRIF